MRAFPCIIAALAAGCAEPAGVWAGPAGGGEWSFAVVAGGGEVVAYACGQGEALAGSRWFAGEAPGGVLDVEQDGWRLRGALRAGEASLELTPPEGGPVQGGALAAAEPAGLFASEEGGCRTGAVVWEDGAALDLRGTWCDGEGAVAQVEPVDTVVVVQDGAVRVRVPDQGVEELWLRRVEWPGD